MAESGDTGSTRALSPGDATAATAAGAATSREELPRGSCVGRYVILDPLGKGGMGVVYKAYDPELDRPIALKLLNSEKGEIASAFRERLLREAQALARLSHPNVVAVHDVGTFGTNVFIAMEFVEGVTLRRWLRQCPRSQREILDHFCAAAEGLKAAHRAGLVHRDFKPDNVIVGNDGRTRVLDFGLVRAAAAESVASVASAASAADAAALDPAQATLGDRPSAVGATPKPRKKPPAKPVSATDPGSTTNTPSSSGGRLLTPLTRAGSVMGTPRYMAPEQHLGTTIDERADQFSFCVALYQALYGVYPFADETDEELRANVLAGHVDEPPAGARVPRWLRQALLRGLSALPDARYPSMAELLDALKNAPRLARRRWLRVGVVLAASATVAVGWRIAVRREVRACAGAESKLSGVWDEARRAAIRTAFRTSGLPYAEAALSTVERSFDGYAHAWVAMHVDTCEATRVRGEQSQELLDLRMTCLADRLMQLKTLSDLYVTADGSAVERAAQSAQSLPGLEPCADPVALRAPIAPPRDPATRRRVDEVRQQLARASALGLLTRFAEGVKVTRAALSAAEALRYPPIEAEAQLRLGELLSEHGDFADSTRSLHRALVAALAGHHEEAAARAATDLIQAIGDHQSHYEEADRWADLAEALVGRLQHKDELLGLMYNRRSLLRVRESRFDEALGDATRAREIEQRILGPDHFAVAETDHNLGNIYRAKAKYPEALESYRHSLAIEQRTLGPDHPRLISSLIGVADVYGESGEHERAITEYQHALAALRRVQADHPMIPLIYNNMGDDMQALGRTREALEYYQRAYDGWLKRLGPSHETATALNNMGDAELELNQPDEALRYFNQSFEQCGRALGPGHLLCGQILGGIGESDRKLGKLDEAMAVLGRSLAIREKALGLTHPQLVQPLLAIGRVELARHSIAKAQAALTRALAIAEPQPGDGLDLAGVRFALAQVLWSAGERTRALELGIQARDAYVKGGAPMRRSLAEASAWVDRHR